MKNYNNIIREICDELNIKLTEMADTWVKVLEKDHKVHYIMGYKFDLNNQAESLLFDDKFETHELLNYLNIPVIKHHVILHDYHKDEIIDLFHLYQNNVIIKGNEGSCGNEVHHITDENELINVIDDLLIKQYSCSLCPFYKIDNEYRIIVLNKEIKLMYGKINPHVIGDGINDINTLAREFNNNYYHNKDLGDYIPKKDELVVLDYRHNLSNGAILFEDIDLSIKNNLIKIVNDLLNKTNIKFASIDIISSNNELMIMEVNSGIMMNNFIKLDNDGYNRAKRIYKEAIELMFKE